MFGSLLQHTILEAGINADHLIMDPHIPTTLAFVKTLQTVTGTFPSTVNPVQT